MKAVFTDIGNIMRKIQILCLLILLIFGFSSCMQSNRTQKGGLRIEEYSLDNIPRYRITVCGDDGTILSEKIMEFVPDFTTLEDGILQQHTGSGLISQYQFFDIVNNRISPVYENPQCIENGKIVHMTFSQEGILLEVRDIFDTNVFYRAYRRDFAPVAVPSDALKEAVFVDADTLKVTYLLGDHYEEVQEVIDLRQEN